MKAGYEIIVADNLYNSCEEALRRVEQISGKKVLVNVDLCDGEAVDALFASHPEIDAVIHFAAYKAVGESVQKPLEYYTNNLGCTPTVLNAMRKYNVKLVFHGPPPRFTETGALYAAKWMTASRGPLPRHHPRSTPSCSPR